jgi:hypothetical protein
MLRRRGDMPGRAAGGDHDRIAKRRASREIDGYDLFGLIVIERIEDAREQGRLCKVFRLGNSLRRTRRAQGAGSYRQMRYLGPVEKDCLEPEIQTPCSIAMPSPCRLLPQLNLNNNSTTVRRTRPEPKPALTGIRRFWCGVPLRSHRSGVFRSSSIRGRILRGTPNPASHNLL